MNFLSHYYFERYSTHSERVLGALLPDLLKNVDKSYNFHPQRFEEAILAHPKTMRISEGWYQHVQVDKSFHSSTFFLNHCHVLRKILVPVLSPYPIRPSFMAHIAIELLLDHLLIAHNMVNPIRLYEHLEQVNKSTIERYLNILGIADTTRFFSFYTEFLTSRYMLDYADLNVIPHALFHICKRVWSFELDKNDIKKLSAVLLDYKENHLLDFSDVFREVQDHLD